MTDQPTNQRDFVEVYKEDIPPTKDVEDNPAITEQIKAFDGLVLPPSSLSRKLNF